VLGLIALLLDNGSVRKAAAVAASAAVLFLKLRLLFDLCCELLLVLFSSVSNKNVC
jgi:hypothetical protein